MKVWLAVAFAIIGSLLVAGLLFLTVQQPRGKPVTLRPPPTPAPIVVYISGAVAKSGLYSLPVGSRVNDAVQAAGGFTSEANPDGLNLAAQLTDGERIYVSSVGEQPAIPLSTAELPASSSRQGGLVIVNINTAGQQELESLPEIGPKTAQAIIAYRTAHGFFKSIEDILKVDGIGPVTFEQIKDWITIADLP